METKQQKHTAIPWSIDDQYSEEIAAESGELLACCYPMNNAPEETRGNARYIVLSANYHERLVEALSPFAAFSKAADSEVLQWSVHVPGIGPVTLHRSAFSEAESLLAEIEREEQ